jgi:hypothetical protein
MTVYDGAVRVQGKDGTELRPWRVVVYQHGVGFTYTKVPAQSRGAAALAARRRWPNGVVLAY